jgi:hypothetical protein
MDSAWAVWAGMILLAVAAGPAAPADPSPRDDKKADAKSLLPITVREEQGGIAGTSVTEWTVDKDGKWKVAHFTVRGGAEVDGSRTEKTGTLTREQLAKLTEQIAKLDPARLPKQMGTAGTVNPHNFIVQVGDTKVTIAGVPPRIDDTPKKNILQAAPAGDARAADEWRRAAEIVQAVIDATSPG